jgi:hypothetical protein
MSARNLPADNVWPASKTDNPTTICEPTAQQTWYPRRFTNLWASTACYRDSFTLHLPAAVEHMLFGTESITNFLMFKSCYYLSG